MAASVVAWLVLAGPAAATPAQEKALAERYAPVVRLVEQQEECGPGEPYDPVDVDVILRNREVLLRGPWDTTNVMRVAPNARDLATAPDGYHLDFPGLAIKPGCDYEKFSRRAAAGTLPATYARVITESGKPGKLALQYWFYYLFNDFNNKHESDWEMIQLVFDADDAAEALRTTPVEIGYSQHQGAERADWGSDKLELVGGTHPVVYPASGSHANYFNPAVHLGRNAQQGIGCDTTLAPHRELRPVVRSVPADEDAYRAAYPWLAYPGHWGELRPGEFNGPTGPNTKGQWEEPISWMEDEWRDSSVTIPSSLTLGGSDSAGFFCSAVANGSKLYALAKTQLQAFLLGSAVVLAFLLWAASRTRWRPATPLRLARRRSFGQIVTASTRMCWQQARFLLLLVAVLLPIPVLAAASSIMVNRVSRAETLFDVIGSLTFGVTTIFNTLALVLVPVAVALAAREVDRGHPARLGAVLRATLSRSWAAVKAGALNLVVVVLLALTIVGIPVALVLVVRWTLFSQVVALEDTRRTRAVLGRSAELVQGRWWAALTITALGLLPAAVIGPFVGAAAILALGVDFEIANLLSSVVALVLLPFFSLMKVYLYHDGLVRDAHRDARQDAPETLPAELDDDGALVTT